MHLLSLLKANVKLFVRNLKNLKHFFKLSHPKIQQVRYMLCLLTPPPPTFQQPPPPPHTHPNFPPRQCYSCGSTAHLQRNCDRKPPFRGSGRALRGSYRYPGNHAARPACLSRNNQPDIVTCFNCGGLGHLAGQCPSPPLN